MKLKDIKIGEAYNARVKVLSIEKGLMEAEIATALIDKKGKPLVPDVAYFTERDIAAFSPINPYEPLMLDTINRIPENTPKYDPFRKFREGDIVEPCQVKGRWFGTAWKNRSGIRFTVTKDEDEEGVMWVKDPDSLHPKDVEAVFFQLVTPVEELERYIIIHNENNKYYEVCWKDDDEPDGRTGRVRCRATFWYYHPPQTYTQKEAKEAAESERDRLNAEYRKEQQ